VDDAHYFRDPEEWRRWLAEHHDSDTECWVGFHKAGSGAGGLTNAAAVDQALCFGWIDGVIRPVDERRYAKRFTPRRPGSIWSRVNVAKVERLRAAGVMTPAGEAAFAARREDRTGVYSFERPPATLTDDDRAAFSAEAWGFFTGQAPWYQRTAAHWVTGAKKPETRARRLATLVADSAAGRRLRHLSNDRRQ